MNNKQINTLISDRTHDLTEMAIDMSRDRRVLLDFVETCAVAPREDGKYTHNREELQIKARKVLADLVSENSEK